MSKINKISLDICQAELKDLIKYLIDYILIQIMLTQFSKLQIVISQIILSIHHLILPKTTLKWSKILIKDHLREAVRNKQEILVQVYFHNNLK